MNVNVRNRKQSLMLALTVVMILAVSCLVAAFLRIEDNNGTRSAVPTTARHPKAVGVPAAPLKTTAAAYTPPAPALPPRALAVLAPVAEGRETAVTPELKVAAAAVNRQIARLQSLLAGRDFEQARELLEPLGVDLNSRGQPFVWAWHKLYAVLLAPDAVEFLDYALDRVAPEPLQCDLFVSALSWSEAPESERILLRRPRNERVEGMVCAYLRAVGLRGGEAARKTAAEYFRATEKPLAVRLAAADALAGLNEPEANQLLAEARQNEKDGTVRRYLDLLKTVQDPPAEGLLVSGAVILPDTPAVKDAQEPAPTAPDLRMGDLIMECAGLPCRQPADLMKSLGEAPERVPEDAAKFTLKIHRAGTVVWLEADARQIMAAAFSPLRPIAPGGEKPGGKTADAETSPAASGTRPRADEANDF